MNLRNALLVAVMLHLLQATAAAANTATDSAPPSRGLFGSVLKLILEPIYARHDGKDPLQDPEYREAMRAQWRLAYEAKYAFLVRKRNLSPPITGQLYDLLVRQAFESLQRHAEPGTSEFKNLKREQDRELAALLGDHGLAQFHEYDATFEYRNEVSRLQLDFSGDTAVLREDQVDALIAILRDSSRVLERAAAVLSPAQLAVLEARLRREQGHEKLLAIARQIVPAGKTGIARAASPSSSPFLVGVNDDRLVQDAEYRGAWLLQKRLEVESTYIDVPRLLKLSPGLTDRFFTLLVDQQLARVDDPSQTTRFWRETLQREERQLAALLGERGLAQFREFRDAYGYRFRVKLFRIDIGAGPDALRESQVEALISVLREADRQRWSDARIREAAAGFLTPAQLAALEDWMPRDPG